MSTSHISEFVADSGFVCAASEFRSACVEEAFFGEYEGKRYCVLHFRGKEKRAEFNEALRRKVDKEDYNFEGVWFPPDAVFSGVFPARAEFCQATFLGGAYFNGATFPKGADFRQATFNAGANFSGTTFTEGGHFSFANFHGEVDFTAATFNAQANFNGATFRDHVRFSALEKHLLTSSEWLNLQFARIEKPEHFYFHTFILRPSWFVNVNPRKFDFTHIEWDFLSVKEEITDLTRRGVLAPYRMLAITYRNLADNAEENHRYIEASKFRYKAMEARRLEHWRGFDFRKLSWWYWLASGYGERTWRALIVLIGILIIFAALYTKVGFLRWSPLILSEYAFVTAKRDETGAPLKFPDALTYSAAVMTLQRPQPPPVTTAAHTVVLLETILGPVQAALLALAIRRKFMR